ncbi:MAG: NifB/NifX family molybdenum-iron cluster-binding protein [Candidatus Pacebacteria bacterium]|nr:NifB/NifX family molybdenum-iron cluster-binding protein [Candidatus Paceibacterota bacterium]
MKIAISCDGKNLNSKISEVFARCPYFLIIKIEDKEVKEVKEIENKSDVQTTGAGISAAQLVAEQNIKAVITKNIGPRAFDVLKQFNIEVYFDEGNVKESLQRFIQGKAKKIT